MSQVADESRIAQFRVLLQRADAFRAAQQWTAALDLYCTALTQAPRLPFLHHNAGICRFALADYDEALNLSTEACRLDPALWQALLIRVKTLRCLGRVDEARRVLAAEPRQDIPALQSERASVAMNELGDAAGAGEIALAQADLAATPELQLTRWLAALYDPGTVSSDDVAAGLIKYSEDHLGATHAPHPAESPEFHGHQAQCATMPKRLRVGVISPQLRAAPVYFFGIGALRQLAASVDLVFFHRSCKEDWATEHFRAIASEWVNVADVEPEALEHEIRRHALDVVVDMGGWMDAPALRALANKPAKRMYKWVGGQAASTGLVAFDGFLSDPAQSPVALQSLYVEPLCLLDAGYVSYTCPAYFPSPRAPDPGIVLGVIANPAKISRAFLRYLSEQFVLWRREGITPSLRLIEHRYRHPELRRRIEAALGEHISVEFIVPDGHVAYLNEVAKLHSVIDTFPYTGGLTTIEALMLGVPCRTRVGRLFCERHTYAHCTYAGIDPLHYQIDGWLPTDSDAAARKALLPADSPRLQHHAVADDLLRVFSGH